MQCHDVLPCTLLFQLHPWWQQVHGALCSDHAEHTAPDIVKQSSKPSESINLLSSLPISRRSSTKDLSRGSRSSRLQSVSLKATSVNFLLVARKISFKSSCLWLNKGTKNKSDCCSRWVDEGSVQFCHFRGLWKILLLNLARCLERSRCF